MHLGAARSQAYSDRDKFPDSAYLYLELLKRCLSNTLHPDRELMFVRPSGIRGRIIKWLAPASLKFATPFPYNEDMRLIGRDWPPSAETMIGLRRLDNIQYCIEHVLRHAVPGDFIETGVWRGGATIFMRGCLKAFGDDCRRVWVADSFEGLPKPSPNKYPHDAGDIHHSYEYLRVSDEDVRRNFARYKLLYDRVKFLKGWFRDTLKTADIGDLAILRLDGDMYESTMDALNALYDRVVIGGFIIVDDYGAVPGCKQAIVDFRLSRGIQDPICEIDWTGVYWQRSK